MKKTVLVFLLCNAAFAYAQPSLFELKKEFNIVTVDSSHIAFPDVAMLKNGGLMVVYREGGDHYETGRLMKTFSNDNGDSWSIPEILYDDPIFDDRDPSITVLRSGEVLLTFFKYIRGKKDSIPGNHQVYTAISKDNGKTFSEPVPIGKAPLVVERSYIKNNSFWTDAKGKPVTVEAVSSPVIEVGEYLYLATYSGTPLYYTDKDKMLSPNTEIYVYRTKSNVIKWQLLSKLNFPQDVWVSEPFLFSISENHFMMHIRSGEKTPFARGSLWQTESKNGGKNWSKSHSIDVVGHAPYLHRLQEKTLISAFRLVDYDAMTLKTAYIISQDMGKTWSEPIIFLDCGKEECGYPSIVDLDNEHFLVVYYCDDAKTIKGEIFKKIF